MKKTDKRTLILEALERLLPGRRLHEITLDEVARASGVGKGTIYLYFKDKEELSFALAGYCMEELCTSLEALAELEPLKRPERAAKVIAKFLKRHYSWFGAMNESAGKIAGLPPEEREKFAANQHNAVSVLAGLLEPLFPPERRREACDSARLLFWIVQGEVQAEMLGIEPLPDKKFLLEAFLRGIEVEPSDNLT